MNRRNTTELTADSTATVCWEYSGCDLRAAAIALEEILITSGIVLTLSLSALITSLRVVFNRFGSYACDDDDNDGC
jgi:hypothetical protein